MNLRDDFSFEALRLISSIHWDSREKEMVRQWRNDDTIRQWMYHDHHITPEEHDKFLVDLATSPTKFLWLGKDHNGRYLGIVSLSRVDLTNKNGYIGIYTRPDLKIWGTGQLILKTIKELAFDTIGLHTLRVETMETNENALRLYRKLGFEEEGRLKEYVHKEGCWHSVIVLSIINKRD